MGSWRVVSVLYSSSRMDANSIISRRKAPSRVSGFESVEVLDVWI